ncbi:MAG: hypothetical protein JW860_13650 [Sedimentisphaerales bacterium]|nr:hypothetical protein [Sedimentisphaerales bacterium]
MEDTGQNSQAIPYETLKRALKAFKKRLKLTALDADSKLGRGAFSSGAQGVCAVTPPSQYPPEVWDELARQGKIRSIGQGLYELVQHHQHE